MKYVKFTHVDPVIPRFKKQILICLLIQVWLTSVLVQAIDWRQLCYNFYEEFLTVYLLKVTNIQESIMYIVSAYPPYNPPSKGENKENKEL